MDKKRVAEILDEMGTLFELKGENPFKCRAFHNGARTVEALTEEIAAVVGEKRLKSIKGIGDHLARVINDLVTTEQSKEYEELRNSLPTGLLDILRVPGLGPKRVKIMYEELKITSLAELKVACDSDRLAKHEGFGKRTQENILAGINQLETASSKHLFSSAKASADRILLAIGKLPGVEKIQVAGSLRRKKEIIGDIDILACVRAKNRANVTAAFVSHEDVGQVIAHGDTKCSVVLKSGINCDLRLVEKKEFPFALNYFTGSKEHNVEMRSRARKVGWSLNEYGFTRIGDLQRKAKLPPACVSEEDIYRSLELEFIPPELREDNGEFAAADEGKLPKLLETKDIRGTFHCHTTFSDGSNTIEEMVKAAKDLGWEYWGVADHSQAAAYAGGLSKEKVREQHERIDKLNSMLPGFRVFKGTECDILSDGTLDYPSSLLASFDYVVVSIHSKFKMTESEATKRTIKALKNKYSTFLGHPTGRLLLSREGYPINLIEVIKAAADYGKGIEINAHPLRLDLDWRFVRLAKEKGVPICINPDAHNVDGLKDVEYGVGIARKGWLEARDVVNTWKTREVEKYFNSIRTK